MTIVSIHPDRVVREVGDRFVKEFSAARDRDDEVERLHWLEAAGVVVPEILSTDGKTLVTARLDGRPLDEVIAAEWTSMARAAKNELIRRVAEVCAKIRDGGFKWPDLVSYHLFIADDHISVLDPARLQRGRLDLSALYWSLDEPTVTKSDRLRFWRYYGGAAKPPRLRRIGHRWRFSPYRWVFQRCAVRSCPPWAPFVNAIDAPFASADEVVARPPDDWIVRVADDAEREWENHRRLMGGGFRVAQPALGGVLSDGRGLIATVRPEGGVPDVRALADLVRRMHVCGLVHGDLCRDRLVARDGQITLVGLEALERTMSRRRRIDDLAAVVRTMGYSCTDLWRGLKRYGGDKRLARAVLKRAGR